ncbi:bis(5'-nucleosyl)-tetraphosphatase [Lachnoclostridium sp. MSJ-17]|uniref:bis(5'-nucleosyl)-tetraphosphatase n=1 Tax=Lachnoclostridium sp. MSJ-17 TaxID=2841516 RepID=UPI00209EA36F|nr:NUDIX domain-containing protein [Lachnoclostridium sp. MSJ-17]
MIAENVKVSLFGSISDGLYSARIGTGGAMNKSAYVVSHKKVREYFDGVVIAVAEFDGLDGERPIVSTYGEVFYEPELRRILSRLRNIRLKSIRCLYEKSCGGIIFYKTRQNTKILLVKNNNGRYWSFPKGHIEDGETEQETAIREIKEETGLDVTLVQGFREISEYSPFGKIRKRVVFFLARAFTDNVKIQEEEIDSYIWVDLQQARKLCSYDNDLRIIEKAELTIHLKG